MTLGELIDVLERAKDDEHVRFDWGGMVPGAFHSYRGYYDQLAMSVRDADSPTVAEVKGWCREADGGEYRGWKGGDYTMSRDTKVWIANTGKATGTELVGATVHSWGGVTLITRAECP